MRGVWQDELIKNKDVRELNIEVNTGRFGQPYPAPHVPIFLYNHYAVTHLVEDIFDPRFWGRYYNWYAATNTLLPPSGWHLPTRQEIIDLGTIIGDHSYAGGYLKSTSSYYWDAPNTGATDQYGMALKGLGDKMYSTGMTQDLRTVYQAWLITDYGADEYGSIWGVSNGNAGLSPSHTGWSGQFKTHGCAVRFIKNNSINTGYVYDIDGNQYPQITIGSQVWMGQDFRCTRFNNGQAIPYVQAPADWSALGATPAQAIPAGTKNGFNPLGWHVPTKAEYDTLIAYLATNTGGKLKETDPEFWDSPNTGATNSTGFNGRGTGYRKYDGQFLDYKRQLLLCCASEIYPGTPYEFFLQYNFDYAYVGYAGAKTGRAVRLIKDDSNNPGTVTFEDQTYPTVQIGSQVYTSQNVRLTKYNDNSLIPLVPDSTPWAALLTGARCYYEIPT